MNKEELLEWLKLTRYHMSSFGGEDNRAYQQIVALIKKEVPEGKPCPICEGKGGFPGEKEYDHNDMPIQDWDDCSVCKGTGKNGASK